MYGKIFARTFENSLSGKGSHVIAVMAYIIAKTVDSRVTLRPEWLAKVIGDTEDRMREAVEFLASPDPESSGPENEGRRIVPTDVRHEYFVPQHEHYRSIRSNDDLREATRLRVARHRANKADQNSEANHGGSPAGRFVFKKPTREELDLHAAKIGLPASEVDKFVNHYESNGWKVGKNPMKSWSHSLVNWKLGWQERNHQAKASNQVRQPPPHDRNANNMNRAIIGQYDNIGKVI